jgi:Domain of unknown function (DUF4398)
MKVSNLSVVAGLGLLAVACGGAPEPRERLATAQASIRAAKEIGADNVPQAQLHAQLAQEQVTLANKLIEDGENERADYVLRRAAADAELAVALTREATTQKQAETAEAVLGPKPNAPTAPMQATNQ